MSVSKRKVINFILYVFLLIPFFKIAYISVSIPYADSIYKIMQLFSIFIIFMIIIKYGKFSKFIFSFAIYFIILDISTILNKADISGGIFLTIRTMAICMLIDYGLKIDTKTFLDSFEFLLSTLVYMNLISILIFKDGMYVNTSVGYTENWLLGYRNLHILYILPAILVSFLNSYYTKGKLCNRNYILLVLSLLSIVLVKSSTSLVGITVLIVFLVLNKILKNEKIFNIKNYFFVYIVSFFSIVIFRIQNLFKFIIVDILDRDLTFTGRTYIWDYVIEFIKQKPIIGYGIEESNVRLNKTTFMVSTHAHDQILEIIYKSGIVGIIVYAYILIKSVYEVYKYRKTKISQFISIIIFAYLFMMLTEYFSLDLTMFLFVFCLDIKYLIKESGENESIN